MSFPRAKITRFNENVPCTPSPADYNVVIKNGANGVKIPKSERFDKSPAASDNGSLTSTTSTPCFRTPTLPKKKKGIFSSLSSRKPKTQLFTELTELEALRDKIVECKNKDTYIKELTEELEEMKDTLYTLEKQKQQVISEKNRLEERAKEFKEEHQMTLSSIYLEHDKETKALREMVAVADEELKKVKEELEVLKKKMAAVEEELVKNKLAHTNVLERMEESIQEKNQLTEEKQQLKDELEARLAGAENRHKEQIDALNKKYEDSLTTLKSSLQKSVAELQTLLNDEKVSSKNKLKEAQKKHETEKNTIIEEFNTRIKQIEEDSKEANLIAEMQLSEKLKDVMNGWQLKLQEQERQADAILKECQAISEYSIIQCEFEKNTIKADLANKIKEHERLQKENADLIKSCRELDIRNADLEILIEGTKMQLASKDDAEKEHIHQLQMYQSQKKLYEISIQQSHETIETLKKRLLNSDRDVEQLKLELELCELSKLEYQGKCNQLTEELEVIEKLNEDMELQYEVTLKKTEDRIQCMELKLCQKVEKYKEIAQKEISVLREAIQAKDSSLQEVMEQLKEQNLLNGQAQLLIELAQKELDGHIKATKEAKQDALELEQIVVEAKSKLEEAVAENAKLSEDLQNYKIKNQEMDGLTKQLTQYQDKAETYAQYCDYYKMKATNYEGDIEDLQLINKRYIEQSGKYDELLQKYELAEVRNAELEKKVAEQESLIGPFREQLESYEVEHNALLCEKSQAELEAKAMGLKYAELLGHQNQKQKIKHMIDLKAKNIELNEVKKELEVKIRTQSRTIEKLKKDLASLTKSPRKSKLVSTDKENISSPNRTLNSSRVESPGPLRDRN